MTDILTLVIGLVLLIAAGAALLRRPKRPKAVRHDEPTTFTRPEDS